MYNSSLHVFLYEFYGGIPVGLPDEVRKGTGITPVPFPLSFLSFHPEQSSQFFLAEISINLRSDLRLLPKVGQKLKSRMYCRYAVIRLH